VKKEIVDLLVEELKEHVEEIKRLPISDRLAFIGILVEEIAGVPAIYLPKDVANIIVENLRKEVNFGRDLF
jgi:hypothetical protein